MVIKENTVMEDLHLKLSMCKLVKGTLPDFKKQK